MKCQFCEKKATHINPASVCDFHYVEAYSTQNIGGVQVHFKKMLKDQLEKVGMWKKEDETLDQWHIRCKERFYGKAKKKED
jgi:hypothetical protein|tara:strand:- start:8391 stop:8633 length:243 start_codon:yes stop_codon:yes gene_type:complete